MNTTFLGDEIQRLALRWNEVNVLLDIERQSSPKTGTTIRRAALILLAAHFEGSLKGFTKSIIQDLNRFSNFSAFPAGLKRAHVRRYTAPPPNQQAGLKETNAREESLIEHLGIGKIEVNERSFVCDLGNPTPKTIEHICDLFGFKQAMRSLEQSELEIYFQDEPEKAAAIENKLKEHIERHTKSFPYSTDTSIIRMPLTPTNRVETPIWHEVVNNLYLHRNKVAHGEELGSLGRTDLDDLFMKTRGLTYGLALALTTAGGKGGTH